MPLSREVDLMPGGDYAFVVVRKGVPHTQLWLYTWDQVEDDDDDGRSSPPMEIAVLADREAIQLAKYLLQLVGHEAHKQISIPNQAWNKAGREIQNGNEEESTETDW